jgi:hypothetical protein
LSINTIQENWGVANPGGTTSLVIPLTGGNNPGGVATTAGNAVLVIVGASGSITGVPAGWPAADRSIAGAVYAYSMPSIDAGETSWTFTLSGSSSVDWSFYVAELEGVDPTVPLEVSAVTLSGQTVVDGGTFSTTTTGQTAALDTVAYAAFVADRTVAPTWSNYTNDFEEVQEVTTGTPTLRLAVARKTVVGTTGTFETTATLDTSGSSSTSTAALIVVYRAANSPVVAPLDMFVGFGQGTHGGINSHNGVSNMLSVPVAAPSGTWGTNYFIQPGSARNSDYGLRIVAAGNAAAVSVGTLAGSASCFGFDTRVVSATGTVLVAHYGLRWQLLYDTSTNKFGVRAGTTGTISWQSGTTALNTFVWVDIRAKYNTTTWRVEWTLETGADTYTEQPAAELTGQSAGLISNQSLNLGTSTAQTMTADFANVCLSHYYVAYPLGPHQIRLLTVDLAGTPTLSGTSTNFSVFTANGTLAAWNATNARDAVDEVPPTISASADGVCQTAVAASDYIEFPMAAPTLADDEIISGVRMLAAMWGGTGTGTGTVGIRSWDGTTETILIAASTSYDAGSPTAISSTEPRWECAMWPMPNGWTAAKLAAAALRFGFGTDETPDMGVDALYLEYATRKGRIQPLFGTLASTATDPNSLGIRSLTVDTNSEPGKAANLYYEEDGSPTNVPVAANTSQTEVIDAPNAPTVNYIKLEPDPEPENIEPY